MSYLRAVWAIAAKDLRAEAHTKEVVSGMLVFALVVLLIFSFALDLQGDAGRAAAPGILWSTIAFAGTLGLNRSMAREQANGCIDGLLLAPIDRSAIYLAKVLSNLAFIAVVEVVLLPLATLLFDAPLLRPGALVIIVLGTVGYAAAGTLLATIAGNTHAREVMLPVLLLPLVVPVLIPAVQATAWVMDGGSLGEVRSWVGLLGGYGLIILALSLATFEFAVKE